MTALGATASITAITAIPGSFKTTRAVWWIKQAIEAGEQVYVCNLNGINIPGVIPWEDPTRWRELPAGSVLVVDEAQRFFRARRGGDAPEYITAMETIRHEGVRLIVITQRISYLDSHLRGLVGFHEHMIREDGQPFATIVRNNGVIENTDELLKRKHASHYDTEKWTPDPELFGYFNSAQVHTVKRVVKSKYKRGAVVLGVCCALIVGVFAWVFAGRSEAEAADQGAAASAPTAPPSGPLAAARSRAQGDAKPLTPEEYVQQLVPRVQEAPWSAPVFDGAQPQAEPFLYCMSSGSELGRKTCSCITEQGTRYLLPKKRCFEIARYGPAYNPFKAAPQPGSPGQLSLESERGKPHDVGSPGPRGTKTDPGNVGSPQMGEVWGRKPETIRADWGS